MLIEIESSEDPKISDFKDICTYQKRSKRALIIEGTRPLNRAFCSGNFIIHKLLVTPQAWEKLNVEMPLLSSYIENIEVMRARNRLVQEIVGYPFHRGCIAIATQSRSPQTLGSHQIILDRVVDPDNLGSIFRSAYGLGFSGVVCGPGSADPFYRKSIRSSIGCTLSLPFIRSLDLLSYCKEEILSKQGFLMALELTNAQQIRWQEDRKSAVAKTLPCAIIVGNEGMGISKEIIELAQATMQIPMAKNDISLNVSVAAAIGMHFLLGIENTYSI